MAAKKTPQDAQPSKTIVEIKFRPNLNYFTDAFKIASAFEADFEDWQTSHDPYQALLYSSSKYEIMRVSSDSIAVIYETHGIEEALRTRLEKVIQLFFVPNELEEIRRVGVRKVQVLNSNEEFDTLVNKLVTNFNANAAELSEISFDKVADYAFVLDGIKNGFKNHIRFGAVTPEEGRQRFSPSFKNPSTEFSKNGVFLDIDVYNDETLSFGDLQTNIDKLISESEEITSGYSKLIKGKLKG